MKIEHALTHGHPVIQSHSQASFLPSLSSHAWEPGNVVSIVQAMQDKGLFGGRGFGIPSGQLTVNLPSQLGPLSSKSLWYAAVSETQTT